MTMKGKGKKNCIVRKSVAVSRNASAVYRILYRILAEKGKRIREDIKQ